MTSRWASLPILHRRIVMWGAGDQCRVNRWILAELGYDIAALIDDSEGMVSPLDGVPLLEGMAGLVNWRQGQSGDLGFVLAIGNPFGHVRLALHDKLTALGLSPVSFADPAALICHSAILADGLQVMAGAVIHNEAVIDSQCIVNTRALVEHDCHLEGGVEIGPGAILSGRVRVGSNSWIGAGATILPRLAIGRNVIVGAGAVVTRDVPDGTVAVGNPARVMAGKSTPSARYEDEKK